VFYVRYFVKGPPIWAENRRLQRVEHREMRMPFFSIFKRELLGNTLTACWWMAGGFVSCTTRFRRCSQRIYKRIWG